MHLTLPTPLDIKNVTLDAYDLGRMVMSIPNASQLATLRWGAVSNADMLAYLVSTTPGKLSADAQIPRIGAANEDGKGSGIERREHLVIRDLDLLPYRVEEYPDEYDNESPARLLGRIVAHADYRFRPKGWDWRDPKHPNPQVNGEPIGIPKPAGANVELIELFDEKVEELLDHHCRGQDCYELVNLATNVSHLRKGLAKHLVTWLFRFCDEQQLDYKLMASPMGRGLYKGCGFLEEGQGDKAAVEIDMAEWGGEGIHQHFYMVRHPEKLNS
jgi:hypothetical protein